MNMKKQIGKNGVPFLSFPALDKMDWIVNGFSTREGGVSTGMFATMNLTFSRGDEEAAVRENFRRIAAAIGFDENRMVMGRLEHTTNVRVATEEDAGKGYGKEPDYAGIDGLITNVPNLPLMTTYADCVPLYFADPVHRAIGLSHSGWRGTVNRMGKATLDAMKEAYGTRAEDVTACIGPSICKDCYEVGEDVAEEFARNFTEESLERILVRKENGKYQLDLWAANQVILTEAGVPAEQIVTAGLCTCCNSDWLFSHRATHGKRGVMAAFLMIR